jgi:hypothetical protein
LNWDELCKLDDRLLAIYQEAGAFRCLNEAGEPIRTFSAERAAMLRKNPNFCKQQLWRGVPGKRGEVGLLDQTKQCVGWTAAVPELASAEAYDIAYRAIERNLTGCQHDGECYLYDYPEPKGIQPCGNCGSSVLGSDVKDTPQMTSWTCQCGARRESLKRNKPHGVYNLLDGLRHKAGLQGPPEFFDETTHVPDDAAEPVFIVRNEVYGIETYQALDIDGRLQRGEITKGYARNCILLISDEERARLLAGPLKKSDVTGLLAWKPVVLTWRDPELEKKLANAGIQLNIMEDVPLNLQQVRDTVKVIGKPQQIGRDDMPAEVLDGWLGQIVRDHMADFPIAYAWPAVLTIASALLPQFDERSNLYTALVGPVGNGKSQAIERACQLFGLGEQDKLPRLDMMSGSAEGLIKRIGDLDMQPGSPVLMNVDELGHLMEKAQLEGSSFPYILDRAFYYTKFQATLARAREVTFNCRLSLIGGIVDEDFSNLFGSKTKGGLHDRFIFGQQPTGYQYHYKKFRGSPVFTPAAPAPPAEEGEVPFSDSPAVRPVTVAIHPDVEDAAKKWKQDYPILMEGRCVELALRAAVIAAAFDCRTELRAKDLGPALAFALYQAEVRKTLKPNPGETMEAKFQNAVIDWLDAHLPATDDEPGPYIKRRDLYKKVHAERYGFGVADRAMQALEANGEIGTGVLGKSRVVRRLPD